MILLIHVLNMVRQALFWRVRLSHHQLLSTDLNLLLIIKGMISQPYIGIIFLLSKRFQPQPFGEWLNVFSQYHQKQLLGKYMRLKIQIIG